jgi:hypothetical protein
MVEVDSAFGKLFEFFFVKQKNLHCETIESFAPYSMILFMLALVAQQSIPPN